MRVIRRAQRTLIGLCGKVQARGVNTCSPMLRLNTRALAGIGLGVLTTMGVCAHTQSKSEAEKNETLKFEHLMDERDNSKKFDHMKIFSGSANRQLAEEVADGLGVELGRAVLKKFPDGEVGIQLMESVRGKDVYIVQPTCPPLVNDNLMELMLMISATRRASAASITAVMPYFGYARQDRKMSSRVPISAADVSRLLEAVGVDRVIAIDLHCGQIQGFFKPNHPVDNLEAHVVGLKYFVDRVRDNEISSDTLKVVSPDAGGVYRAKKFRDGLKTKGLDCGMAMISKQRVAAGKIARMDLVGSVEGCDCIIVDDMIDSAGTLTKAAGELKRRGAKKVYAFASHGLFSGPGHERIQNSVLEKVVVCNTVPVNPAKVSEKIVQLSVAPLLSEAIARVHLRKSVSELFDKTSTTSTTYM